MKSFHSIKEKKNKTNSWMRSLPIIKSDTNIPNIIVVWLSYKHFKDDDGGSKHLELIQDKHTHKSLEIKTHNFKRDFETKWWKVSIIWRKPVSCCMCVCVLKLMNEWMNEMKADKLIVSRHRRNFIFRKKKNILNE